MPILEIVLLVAVLPVAFGCGYLFLLTLLSGEASPPAPKAPRLRFTVVVPSHNEENGIGATVANLRALDWPEELRRILVVADNCKDATADRARAAGAEVLVRVNEEKRGKGYALELAFHTLLEEGKTDAVVVVDADTVVSPNLLRAFAARIEAGAPAVQADYAVRNPDAHWRTRLMAIALGAFHVLRSRGRERMGTSCSLRGNGMCFAAATLRDVPHKAYGLVEDLEYAVQLGETGRRVHYADEAHVYGEMVDSEKASRSQRTRWEGGRAQLARQRGWPLFARALQSRDPILFDLSLELLVPPLSSVAVGCAAALLVSAGLSLWLHRPTPALFLAAGSTTALVLYVLRGWALSGTGLRGLLDLAFAPFYVVWKLSLKLSGQGKKQSEWVRTARLSEADQAREPGPGGPSKPAA